MKTSTFKKLHRDVLIEWIYDNNNVVLEPHKIIKNLKNDSLSYVASDSTITLNDISRQLFCTDPVQNKYAKVDTSKYLFLNSTNYTPPFGVQHDTAKIYLPANYTFGEYQGFYLKVYTLDFKNKKVYELSNYYFDINESDTSNDLFDITPPLLYQDKIWNKCIQVSIPSVHYVSLQRADGFPISDTINFNLTAGIGLSQTAPILVDFHFITKTQQIGDIKTYFVSPKSTAQIPQYPELESLGMYMKESSRGDYFEVYATYNNSLDEFINFVDTSRYLDKNYYLEFTLTVFEQNIKGKSVTFKIENDFSEIIEFRPILKYSSSVAIIDAEMRLINKSDGSIVSRKSAYGLKPDQISKYSIVLKRIKVRNASKAKIYNKNSYTPHFVDNSGKYKTEENKVKVPVPSLININNISASSKKALNRVSKITGNNYHYIGKMKIGIEPFDNIIKFNIAYKQNPYIIQPIDLTNCQDIRLVFKSDDALVEIPQHLGTSATAHSGICQFKIPESRYKDLKRIYKSGNSVFYITTTNQGIRNTIYSGLFIPMDLLINNGQDPGNSQSPNIIDLNGIDDLSSPKIILDDSDTRQEFAIVTRRKISSKSPPKSGKSSNSSRKSNI